MVDRGGTHRNMNNAYHICYYVYCCRCCIVLLLLLLFPPPILFHFLGKKKSLFWTFWWNWWSINSRLKYFCGSLCQKESGLTLLLLFTGFISQFFRWNNSNVTLNLSLFQFNNWKNEAFNSTSELNSFEYSSLKMTKANKMSETIIMADDEV